ncbi:MAG: toll/interleukin-1 receptor domain-containing protein [Anaerolineae bacterium]|jgi:hypothetical protein|nr:toll/interleukin-1 receptor domain-containing protein [Anaerolineae bacterium]
MMTKEIYISYARRDFEFAAQLYQFLSKRKFSVWFDRESVQAGEDWRLSIAQGIQESAIFLIILSPDAIKSYTVQKELALAEQYHKAIVPIVWRQTKLPPELEYQLAGIKWIDFGEEASLEKLTTIVEILHTRLGKKSVPTSKENLAIADTTVQNIVVQQQIERIYDAEPSNIQAIAASQIEMLRVYYSEVLDQAQKSFRWAIIAAAIGLFFFLGAVVFTMIQDLQNIAIVSLISGSLIEVISGINFYLYGKTSGQLADFQVRLDITQRILLANSICETIEGEFKHETRSEIIKKVLSGDGFS